jgi:hypothetical protein
MLALVSAGAMLGLPGTGLAHDPIEGGGGSPGVDAFHHFNLIAEFPSGSPGSRATNSDIAFFGDLAYVGNYNGFRIFDISKRTPVLLSDTRCVGAQGDPSIVDRNDDGRGDLLVLSVDQTMTGPTCDAVPAAHDDVNGWEGLRLFDVSNPSAPQFITGVYQDCGSHTNTLLPTKDGRTLVLNSSYPLRPGPTCGPVNGPRVGRSATHGVVQVVELDLGNPAASREITELPLRYPGDADNQFTPSEHGLSFPGLVDGMTACHDIAVFPDRGLVAGACAEQAQVWRIDKKTGLPDTTKPKWVFDQPNVDFWHSATFSWDGRVTNFIDESFGEGCPTTTVKKDLSTPDPDDVKEFDSGNMFFMQTTSGRLLSEYRIPRGGGTEDPTYCSSHLGNVVPATDRYLLVNAYYRGGSSVIDFTNPYRPQEIAFYDPAEADTWSAYSYERTSGEKSTLSVFANDGVHTRETGHGFQALEATLDEPVNVVGLSRLNPQVQEQVIKTKIAPRGKAKGHARDRARNHARGRRVGPKRAAQARRAGRAAAMRHGG